MAFSPRFLDELRDRTGLADVIGRRVRLVRKGREHLGLCPFHNEKTPSFTVNEEKGFYHCFGCAAHGNVIDFVMQTESLTFPEAVERLAAEAGMEVPVDTPEARERERQQQSLYGVMEAARTFFTTALRMPEGKEALAYLHGRGLDDAVIARFALGFAADTRGALKTALARDGVSEDQLLAAGLMKRPEDGRAPFDYFRRRIMFPITDRRGQVIAFGGRALGDGQPKYLNSPDTPLFNKGRVLYGLAQAATEARATGEIIVVEGYMDVIALHRAGFENAVATLGTAVTEDQLRALWRLARAPVLCFDGDAAGRRAQARAAARAVVLLTPGYELRFATLPAGEDPDSLIEREGLDTMARVLAGAVPLSEVLWQLEAGGRALETPEARAALEDRLRRHATRIADRTVRSHFLSAFRDRLWRQSRARGGVRRATPVPMPIPAVAPAGGRVDSAGRREQILLAAVITHPELYDHVGERLGMLVFSGAELDKLRQEVLKTLAGQPALDRADLERHLRHSGFSDAVAALVAPRVLEHAFFARPEVSVETAREGWEETYSLYKRRDLRAEIEKAGHRLAGEMSAQAFEVLRALKGEEHAEPEVEAGSGGRSAGPTNER